VQLHDSAILTRLVAELDGGEQTDDETMVIARVL
jgi:hypothetical protein